jgi:hypothetical protein
MTNQSFCFSGRGKTFWNSMAMARVRAVVARWKSSVPGGRYLVRNYRQRVLANDLDLSAAVAFRAAYEQLRRRFIEAIIGSKLHVAQIRRTEWRRFVRVRRVRQRRHCPAPHCWRGEARCTTPFRGASTGACASHNCNTDYR